MKGTLRFLIGLLLMTVVALTGVVATGEQQGSAGEEPVTISFLSPGEESVRMGDFLDNEFAARMIEDLNIELDVSWSPWGQYWDKLTLVLAAQEPLDFYWDGFLSLSQRASRREARDLTDLLENHGQDILRVIPEQHFQATTINGEIIAIPSQRGPISEKFYSFLVRQDIMDEVGVESISSMAELDDFVEAALAADPGLGVFAEGVNPQNYSREYFTDQKISILGAEYSLFIDEFADDSKAYILFEDKEFMRYVADSNRRYVEMGWTPEVYLTDRQGGSGRFATGRYLTRRGAVTRSLESLNSTREGDPDAILVEYLVNPDVPGFIDRPGNEMVYITPYSKNPEKTMEFLNWLYQSQENHDFLIYGVEGKDYTLTATGALNQINTDELFAEWMWRITDYMRFPSDLDPRAIEQMVTWDDNAQYSKAFGFTFDSSSVTAEEAQIFTVMKNDVWPLLDGFVEFTDETYDRILSKLLDAGAERYRAEFERQLAAHRGQQ